MLQKVPWIEDLVKTLGIPKFVTFVCMVLGIHHPCKKADPEGSFALGQHLKFTLF